MAELKACQSASQSECMRANRDWQHRQYATLTTLPHLLWTNSNKSDINLLSISRSTCHKNNSQCNSIKSFPQTHLNLMSKYCQKVDFYWPKNCKSFTAIVVVIVAPPAAHFVVAAFRFDSNMTSTNNTDSVAFPPWSFCGAIRALIAGRAQAPAPASTPALSLKPFTYAIE